MTKKKAATARAERKKLPKPAPKTKAQLIEEIERLNRAIVQRELMILVGSMLFGVSLWEATKQKKPEPTTAITKAKP